jgi:hypothetical protein
VEQEEMQTLNQMKREAYGSSPAYKNKGSQVWEPRPEPSELALKVIDNARQRLRRKLGLE